MEMHERMETIEKVFKENYEHLLHVLSYLTKDKQLAEDIVQDVFERLLINADRMDDVQSIKNYLVKSVRNRLIDYSRKAIPFPYGDDERVTSSMVDRSFEQKVEQSELIRLVLKKLPRDYRYLILAKDYYGFSYDELTYATGCSLNSVKTKLCRARKQFVKHYSKQVNIGSQLNSIAPRSHLA